MDVDTVVDALDDSDIVAVFANGSGSGDWKRDLAAGIGETGRTIIYVAATQPYTTVETDLESRGVDMENVFFLDLASDTESGGKAVRAENCLFLKPGSLTNLSIAISNAIDAVPDPGNVVVLIDGLETLEMYNSPRAVAEFSHFLTGKLRGWGSKGVILSADGLIDSQLKSRLSQFCDADMTLDS